jgi:endo-1,4-beta-D-glucanase Y
MNRSKPARSRAEAQARPVAAIFGLLSAFCAASCAGSGTDSSPGSIPAPTPGSTGGVAAAAGSLGTGGQAAAGGTAGGTPGSAGRGGAGGGGAPGLGGSGGRAASPGASGSGAAGAAGAAGSGGGPVNASACKSTGPTAASGTAKFPFPQHRFSAQCAYPATCNDADVSTGWQRYKERLVVDGGSGTLRVQRPENSNDTVSEGMSYGMLFAVYLGDQETFDKLWQYVQAHLDDKGLMNWQIAADGNTVGRSSATDSDEDIGFALVMADQQWGGYTEAMRAYLDKVLANDFHGDGTIRGGDNYDDVNPSYLAPAFYRTFAAYTGEQRWLQVLDKAYETLNSAANGSTGLVPDWSTGPRGRDYTYDAARTPYRIALDACWNGEPRARVYAEKVGMFFAGVGVANIRDGFALDGTITGMHRNSTFIGPAGVAGMVGAQTVLITDAYAQIAMDLQAGTESYYNLSWALFTGLMMTGNFVDLSAL